ncbi:hypothetical protein Mgra_00004929 [Meloidogyne graminicola]|uniref:Uncharacterized protein n=1 Tax=Meloidogyne graminicola TaxID=189291 RepID=A0A8S9ZRK4_9BILA|nr:hypothetical protein Mgra_00004929 [Meloidogyne graminicola]
MSELTNGTTAIEDENVSGAQAEEGGEEEEEEATLLKKNLKLESEQAEEDAENKENADEKTEDQVPDITNEDPMTTSMDGIEEIANEPKEDEQPKENGVEKVEEENTEQDVAEIPVSILDGGNEEKPQEEKEQKVEAEEEQAEAPEEEQKIEEAPQEEEAAADPPKEEESVAEKEFELQAPPVPKRPRTPNELDEPQVESEQKSESEQPQEDDGEAEQPPSILPVEIPVEVSGGGDGGEAVEGGTLRNGIIEFPRRESASKQSTIASPIPATPKSGATATPKSTRSGRAFDFDSKKASGKKTTFEDEVLSVKSPKSRGSRSPRSPRTPKTPTSQVEEPKPEEIEDQPKEDESEVLESDAGKLAAEEEERQRQASFEERQKEREEEEDRFKRMTSWDRGEDGLPKEEPKDESIAEKEDTIAEEVEKESIKEESKAEESQQEEVPPVPESEAGEQTESKAEEPEQTESKAEEPGDQAEEQEKPSRDELEGSPAPPPPRPERSPSPDLKAETKPARMPAGESFSSWTAAERDSYKPISPWVDRSSKYRNEYTVGEPPAAPTAYTAYFDDLVTSGPFASSLYSSSRLLERSRSRTRERRHALRSQSQSRNYFRSVVESTNPLFLYRFASQLPAPLRTRDYSTPASSLISRAPTAGSSYTSFMDYAGAKQYEMARSQSLQRSPLYQSNLALSRSTSRGGIDYYLGTGRSSRVDSYVDSLHRPYDWNVPSNYEVYRASSRGQIGFAPLSNYQMDLLRSSNYSALRSGSAPRTSVYAGFYPYS